MEHRFGKIMATGERTINVLPDLRSGAVEARELHRYPRLRIYVLRSRPHEGPLSANDRHRMRHLAVVSQVVPEPVAERPADHASLGGHRFVRLKLVDPHAVEVPSGANTFQGIIGHHLHNPEEAVGRCAAHVQEAMKGR